MLMLGNPTKPAAQDDLLIYSLSVARAISPTAEIVGEFVGRANFANIVTPGAEDRGLLRFGARYTINGVRLDAGILLGLTPRDPEIRIHRRLHLGLQRVQGARRCCRSPKAHAYGNDFLFVPAEQVEGLKLDELSRRLCDRHSGLGGDGVIYYTIAPDGTAQMKLINTDGSPSELVRQRLALPRRAGVVSARAAATARRSTEVRVDTEAGWKTLSLISRQGGRYTFRAAMGQPERVVEEQIEAAGETLTVTTLAIGNPQCVALMKELPDLPRFQSPRPRAVDAHAFPARHQRRVRRRRGARSRPHPDLGARCRPDPRVGHRRVRVGDCRDRARRRRPRHRR